MIPAEPRVTDRLLGNLPRSIRSPVILPVHPVSIRARADSRQQYLYTRELPESKYPARKLVVSLCSLLKHGAAGRPLGNLQRSIRSPLILPVHPVSIRARADSRQQYLYTGLSGDNSFSRFSLKLFTALCCCFKHLIYTEIDTVVQSLVKIGPAVWVWL